MSYSDVRYREYLNRYHMFMNGGSFSGAYGALHDALRFVTTLTGAQRANILALQGVVNSLERRYQDAYNCFEQALYRRLGSDDPSPDLARQCLDFGICLLNIPDSDAQPTYWRERAHGEIDRAMAYCHELYEPDHPVHIITNGFRGFALDRLGNPRGALAMEDTRKRIMGDIPPIDKGSLTYHAWMSGLDWLYRCQALVPVAESNGTVQYTAIVPAVDDWLPDFRRFTVSVPA